jgi:hypothetical protein
MDYREIRKGRALFKIEQSISYCKITVLFAMGRTIPTANMMIQIETDAFLRSYGKGLSGKLEQRALYNLLQLCKKHTQACGQAVRLVPFHGILMSLMLEQEKQLRKLTDEMTALSSNSSLEGVTTI